MDYKVTMQTGDILLNPSKDKIEHQIENHSVCTSVQFTDYVYDEAGNMCGIKCFADLGMAMDLIMAMRSLRLGLLKHIHLPMIIHQLMDRQIGMMAAIR